MSYAKDRRVRLAEALFGAILAFTLVMLLGGAVKDGPSIGAGAIGGMSLIGVFTLTYRAWRSH